MADEKKLPQQKVKKLGKAGKGKKEDFVIIIDDSYIKDKDKLNEIILQAPMAKGGRAGFKSGSKGCKLAMKGKGKAYGKNS